VSEERKDKPQAKGFGGGGPMGSLGKPVEKAKNFKGTLFRLMRYLKPQRTKFMTVFIFAILSTIFSIIGPKIMIKAVNKIAEGFGAKMMALKLHQPIPAMDFKYIGQIVLILSLIHI